MRVLWALSSTAPFSRIHANLYAIHAVVIKWANKFVYVYFLLFWNLIQNTMSYIQCPPVINLKKEHVTEIHFNVQNVFSGVLHGFKFIIGLNGSYALFRISLFVQILFRTLAVFLCLLIYNVRLFLSLHKLTTYINCYSHLQSNCLSIVETLLHQRWWGTQSWDIQWIFIICIRDIRFWFYFLNQIFCNNTSLLIRTIWCFQARFSFHYIFFFK